MAVFQAAWPHVRRFVRTRALGRNGLGWFGTFGWALLLAVPLVLDRELREVPCGAALPAWLRWLSRLSLGARIGFDTIRQGDSEPLYVVASAPPPRDVARLTKRPRPCCSPRRGRRCARSATPPATRRRSIGARASHAVGA